MASLADKAILSGADNRPPMLEKDMYANEVRLMNERTSDPLALISQHQLNRT
nr:hypothetical protein [Tanacetum cinerariifolium]